MVCFVTDMHSYEYKAEIVYNVNKYYIEKLKLKHDSD